MIAGNTGGGVSISPYNVDIMNSTIAFNGVYGILPYDSTFLTTVTNSIVWENDTLDVGSPAIVTYSDIRTGNTVGEGNISEDPMFVDPSSHDYHLLPGSPAIDAGTDDGAPAEDIEGTPRPQDGDGDTIATTDMGAFEMLAPPYSLRVNAGNGAYTDTSGSDWEADQPYSPGSWGYIGGIAYDRGEGYEIYGTEDDRIYQSVRYNHSGYTFDNMDGTYTVTLHFAETYYTEPGRRVFDVFIEDQEIGGLDIFSRAGGLRTAHMEEVTVTVQDGRLNISFAASAGSQGGPIINGIEIVAVP